MNLTATRNPDGSVLLEWDDSIGESDLFREGDLIASPADSPYTDTDAPTSAVNYSVQRLFSDRAAATVPAIPQGKKWGRSIPGGSTAISWCINNAHLFRPPDAIGLLNGGGPTSVASPSWINQQALRLKPLRDKGIIVFAQTSGLNDVKTIAEKCAANIDAIALVQETGFGVEDGPLPSDLEKWDPSQAATEKRIRAAKVFTDKAGIDLILHMSGKGVPWRSDDIPTWNYTAFANIVGDTFPNVIQTQRDYQSDHESNNGRVNRAIELVKNQIPTWLPQVTLEDSEVNGICHNHENLPHDRAGVFLDLLDEAEAKYGRGAGHSLWSLDTTGLQAVMTETFDRTVA